MNSEENTFEAELVLLNEKELEEHLKKLRKQYGFGNIPLERVFDDFELKWGFEPTT